MITLDLRQKAITIEELLQLASEDPVLIVNRDGSEFLLETADAFDREATQLAQSAKFMSFLAERSRESGSIPLEAIDRRLSESEPS